MNDVFHRNWIQMVYYHLPEYLMTFNTKITAIIAENDLVTQLFPFSRSVKLLIKVSIETKSLPCHNTVKL